MPIAIVTGSGGLIGSEATAFLVEQGFDVIGVDNDMRAYFFGPESTTRPTTERLESTLGESFRAVELDIRDGDGVLRLFEAEGSRIDLVVHTAAQPSHDWAAREPFTDFAVNATGTLHLLEATRRHCPDATFVFCSTNKVYGDRPNDLPLQELDTRLELPRITPGTAAST
jgi:CDP-paratose 2-epimerase